MPKRCECILYVEEGWNVEKIKEVMALRRSVKEYAMILHDKDCHENGEPKKAHYHVYLNFGKTNWKFQDVAKWFDIRAERVGYIKTKDSGVLLNYYLHKSEPDKYQYELEDIIANFDVKDRLEQSVKKRLDEILADCGAGIITRQNFEQHIDPITYAKHEKKIQNAWKYNDHIQAIANAGSRECKIIWVYGRSNRGKTTVCSLYSQQRNLSIYISATGKDPFSHYEGQEVVVLDDLRPTTFPFEELLKILDPNYAMPVNSRYHNKLLRCKYIFVTTVLSPQEFVNALYLQESEVQLYRRLNEVWLVRSNSIEIFEYDAESEIFIPKEMAKNPVPSFLRELQKKKKTEEEINSSHILNAITCSMDEVEEIRDN